MSYVARLQREVPLIPGELPNDYMLRYVASSPVAPGVTVEQWVRGVVDAAALIGHPELTPAAAEQYEVFKMVGHQRASHTINEYRFPSPSSQMALKDTHIFMAVTLSQLQVTLDRLRAVAPELVTPLPDLDAERTATAIGEDMLAGLKRYDQLNAERISRR